MNLHPKPSSTAPSERSQVQRAAPRAHYDAATIHPIVDAAWVCHVAFATPDVLCIPTACWRVGEKVYIHGSNGSRMMKHLASGAPACLTITHLDGLVMARSAFSHSMNYRSVVVHGRFDVVAEADKPALLDALMDHIALGRKEDVREPDRGELAATTVLGMSLHEASAKVRKGPPEDKDEDLSSPAWSGVLPLSEHRGLAHSEAHWQGPLPSYAANWCPSSQEAAHVHTRPL